MATVQTETRQATEHLNKLIAELKNLTVEISVEESKRPTLSPEDADALRKSLIGLVQVSAHVLRSQGDPPGAHHRARQGSLLHLMDTYISDASDESWERMVSHARVVRDRISEARDAFHRIDNIYIFEKSYQQFLATFNARTSYLNTIINANKPIDSKLFRTYRDAYEELIATLESLIENLRAYGRKFINSGSEPGKIRRTMVVAPVATVQERYRHQYTLLAWGSGVLFLAALLIISLMWPSPTPAQLKVQASILALAAGGFSTVMSGLLNISGKIKEIRAAVNVQEDRPRRDRH